MFLVNVTAAIGSSEWDGAVESGREEGESAHVNIIMNNE